MLKASGCEATAWLRRLASKTSFHSVGLNSLRGVSEPAIEQHGSKEKFNLVEKELDAVSERVRLCISSDIPKLASAADYFFRHGREGKRLRPTVLLLMASSLAATTPSSAMLSVDDSPASMYPATVRRRQQRIAEITELIHVASLLHDDVLDSASTRRGLTALNAEQGNKLAILAGDFLLARASVSLASLQTPEVIALMSQCLEHLVAGEVLQMGASADEAASMEFYLKKTAYKTATLFANGCKSIAVLGEHSRGEIEAASKFGQHLGLAFQIIDDVLDFTGNSSELGKPALNDLSSGLATAPVLYAAEEQPELIALIKRRFKDEGDIERALRAVESTKGIEKAQQLASHHAQTAIAALGQLPPPKCLFAQESRVNLINIAGQILSRRK